MNSMKKERSRTDLAGLVSLCVIAAFALGQIGNYLILGGFTAFFTVLVFEVLIVLFAAVAWRGRMPWLLIGVAVGCYVLHFIMSYPEYTDFNWNLMAQCVIAALGGVAGTVLQLKNKERIVRFPFLLCGITVLILAVFFGSWYGFTQQGKQAQGGPRRELWAVPTMYDSVESSEPGTLEELVYDTKAYGTDGRDVQKRALVYLPYGYDETKPYNILYLMHGTGDDENYWLRTHGYNKTMLDRMIELGAIEPLIVVTPTFYVENDFRSGDTTLDPLTFSFKEELRNDLMPLVESRYSTYAETADDAGFAASRDHRAFAGLSRGSVTTAHSAFCGSLDYFSYFGMFSAFRTQESYLRETIRSENVKDLPIHYLYMTTGNYDFAQPNQISGYRMLLELEPRLKWGVNTCFDTFPMRYHSIGNWHLALYNFLQKIF